jgi:hypothetical protein
MGSSVTATCTCGFTGEYLIGGGMEDFETTCCFPCLCETCNTVVEANLLSTPLQCPDCKGLAVVPYDDPSLVGLIGERREVDWNLGGELGRRLILTDGTYRCPN